MEEILSNYAAWLTSKDIGGNYVRIGSTVTVLDKEFDEELVYKIGKFCEGPIPMNGSSPEDSPLASCKNVGDDVV